MERDRPRVVDMGLRKRLRSAFDVLDMGRQHHRRVPAIGRHRVREAVGQYAHHPLGTDLGYSVALVRQIDLLTNGKGGAELGGRLWRQFPE